jgi:hypothetical protein
MAAPTAAGQSAVAAGGEFAIIDMLHFLDNPFPFPPERKILVGATRHEDGSWSSPESLEYHQQRARLLHSLERVPGVIEVEYSSSVDDEFPQETGYAAVDIAVALTTAAVSVASLIVTWISKQPRKHKDTVPGVRLQANGMSLVISHKVPQEHQLRVIEAFIANAGQQSPPGQEPPVGPSD